MHERITVHTEIRCHACHKSTDLITSWRTCPIAFSWLARVSSKSQAGQNGGTRVFHLMERWLYKLLVLFN